MTYEEDALTIACGEIEDLKVEIERLTKQNEFLQSSNKELNDKCHEFEYCLREIRTLVNMVIS